MIGIPVGLLYSNAAEWAIHKYLLHGVGKNKRSIWAFHWHEHHNMVRKNNHLDENYLKKGPRWDNTTKELVGLAALAAVHVPLLPVAPFFTGTVWYCTYNYYRIHKRAHIDTEWGKTNLPWHYDHHMGPNQDANWCVTKPFFDNLMGTRKPYVGTARQKADQERKARKKGKLKARLDVLQAVA